jgi:hypothetical protein
VLALVKLLYVAFELVGVVLATEATGSSAVGLPDPPQFNGVGFGVVFVPGFRDPMLET